MIAVDKTTLVLTIKDKFGNKKEYTVSGKTRYTQDHKSVEMSAFKVNGSVVLHLTHSRSTGADLVSEMSDPGSWLWLEKQRKSTITGSIVKLNEGDITLRATGCPALLQIVFPEYR